MRVWRKPRVPPKREIWPQGFDVSGLGIPDLQHRQYFIRPDDNSDQFRKSGAGAGKPPTQGIGVVGMDTFEPMGGHQKKPPPQYVGGIGLDSFNKG